MFVGFSMATLAIFEFECEVEEYRISCNTWRERDVIRGLLMARYLHEPHKGFASDMDSNGSFTLEANKG